MQKWPHQPTDKHGGTISVPYWKQNSTVKVSSLINPPKNHPPETILVRSANNSDACSEHQKDQQLAALFKGSE